MKNEKRVKSEKAKSEGNNLSFFLNEIKNIPLLSQDEEETVREAAAGNKAAREKLINTNLRFVVNIAKKYQNLGMPMEDLISEGVIGLINAVDRFDAGKNCRFISYAVWWIRQSILKALSEKSRMIRLPVNRVNQLIMIEKAKKMIKNQSSYYLSESTDEEINEIAGLLKMDRKRVEELINISREILSLDNPLSNDSDFALKNLIEDNRYFTPEKITEQRMMKDEIDKVLSTLHGHEADVIRCHFGLGEARPMSFKEIGEKHNLSKERIRQIEEKGLRMLRKPHRKSRLQEYVA